jgi:hypothetical protein
MKIVIPRWFIKEERKEVICVFEKLKNFDKLGGMLGYIPKTLREVIKQYFQKRPGKKIDKKEKAKKEEKRIKLVLRDLHKIIVKRMHKI